MKRNLNSLNEQISRMKSLFTEERLYGNLVENEEVITEGELLKVGSKGDGVKGLQELLGVTTDGIFGDKTKKALMDFQSKNGLKADGVAGPKTLEKLMSLVVKPTNESMNLYEDDISALNLVSKSIVGQEVVDDQGKPLPDSDFVKSTSFFMDQNKIKSNDVQVNGDGGDQGNKDIGDQGNKDGGNQGNKDSVETKSSEEGGEEKKGTYDDQNKGSEEEEGEAKAGTKRKGTEFYQKGKRKNTVTSVLAGVKATKGEIDDNVKACKQGMKELYKQIVKIGDANLELTENELEGLDWCMSTFKNRFEKLGFGIGKEEAEEIYDALNREIPELKDTVEGEKYDVKDDSDLVVAKLKRLGPGKYSFNGRKGYIIASKDRKDGRMKISSDFEKYLLRALKKDPNKWKIVTISQKTDKNNGQFLVREK